jgi:hypothetical protein
MQSKSATGILSMGFGGAILVYVLSSVILDAGYQQTATIYEMQTLQVLASLGGLVAFLLIGLGLWLIIKDRTR